LITISIGISTYDGSTSSDPFNWIRAAGQALYRAKMLGRNRTEVLLMADEVSQGSL
jgi:PleD family two-component response regulator